MRLGGLLAFFALAMNVLVLATVTALFLGQRSRAELPIVYGASALFGLVSAFALTALSDRVARVREASLVFVSLACVLLASFLILPFVGSAYLFAAYPVCTGLAALAVVQAFAVISDCVDAEQAKRLLPLIGSGGTLGAVCAGGAMALIAPRLGTRMLLVFAALAALGAVWVTVILVESHVSERAQSLRPVTGDHRRSSPLVNMIDDFASSLLKDRLLLLFGLGQCVITIASTLLRFEFEAALQQSLGMDKIAVFLGLFNLAANASVLLVQTLLERPILRRFGLAAGLTSLPVVFLLAMPLLWLGSGLMILVTARFAEHVLRFSVARTADDLVLLPLSSAKRRRGKTLIAGALMPLAVLATSGLLFVSSALPAGVRTSLAWLCGGLGLWLALSLRKPYLARLESELSQPRLTLDSISAPSLFTTQAGVQAAMEQTLREVDPRRVAFALTTLSTTEIRIDSYRLQALYDHADPRVREAAYVTATTTGDDSMIDDLFAALIKETDDLARAACARALCKHVPSERAHELERVLQDPCLAVRAELLARRDTHGCLLDPSFELRRAALRVAGETQAAELLPAVVAALADRALAAAAHDALRLWSGEAVVSALAKAFHGKTSPALQKRAIHALGRVRHPAAHKTLTLLLESTSEDLQIAALRGLVRQRRSGNVLEDLSAVMRRGVAIEVRSVQIARLADDSLARAAQPEARNAYVRAELNAWHRRCEARLFLWLALAHPPAEMLRAQLSLASDDRRARAFALELLERRLESGLGRQIAALLGPQPDHTQRLAAERALGVQPGTSALALLSLSNRPIARWLAHALDAQTYPAAEGDPSMSVLETMFVLRTVQLFSRLSSEELRALSSLSQTRRIEAGEALFREGDPCDAFYVIKSGQAEVSKKGKLLATLREGDWFGELALLDDGVRTATVTASVDTELTCVLAADFHELLEEAPSIARGMLGVLAKRQALLLDGQSS